MMRRPTWAVAFFACASANALDPARDIAQFQRTADRVEDGAPARMRARAPKTRRQFEIWSGVGTGTEITLAIPAALACCAALPSRWRWLRRTSQSRKAAA